MFRTDKLHEECGIFGVYSNETADIAQLVYYGLIALQIGRQVVAVIEVALQSFAVVEDVEYAVVFLVVKGVPLELADVA